MASPRTLETRELDERVRAHGGIIESIEWGIRSNAIADPELATVWRGIEEKYEDLRGSMVLASRIMTAARRAA